MVVERSVVGLGKTYKILLDDADAKLFDSRNWYMAVVKNKYFYVSAGSRKNATTLQRELMKPKLGFVVDHINGNTLDYRRSNLRVCTYSQNMQNAGKIPSNHSKFKGVTFVSSNRKNHWRAHICLPEKTLCLGYFGSDVEAARKYDSVARELFGEFARTNESMGLFE